MSSYNNNNNEDDNTDTNNKSTTNKKACQPELGARGACLSLPGRLFLINLIGARQMVNTRQTVLRFWGLANMAKQHV